MGVPEGFLEVSLGLGGGRGTVSVLTRDEDAKDDDWTDPNFFEPGYSVAGSTGFRVWEGTRVAADLLRPASERTYAYVLGARGWEKHEAGADADADEDADADVDVDAAVEGVRVALEGKRVLELGSGTGLAALALAKAGGAHVLATDLRAVVDDVLWVNVDRAAEGEGEGEGEGFFFPGGVRVGEGSVACYPLDWVSVESGEDWCRVTSLARPQLALDPLGCACDVVLGVECVWLAELVPSFVATVEAAFGRGARGGQALLIGRERATEASTVFCSMGDVAAAFRARGLDVQEVVKTKAQDNDPSGEGFVSVYRVRLPS